MVQLMNNKTSELVEVQKIYALIDCKWMYSLKYSTGDKRKIFKARLIARNFIQEKSINYNKKNLFVAKYATICLLCAFAAIFNILMDEIHVVTTFLYVSVKEKVYMRQLVDFRKKRSREVDL